MTRKAVQNLQAYVPGEQPKDADVVKLNTNENPYPPSPRVATALREFDPARLRLYSDPVCSAVRERVATMHGCKPENVFVGNGSDEILALCARAFVERTGAIGFFDPSYSLYPVLAAIEGIAAKPLSLPHDFGWITPPGGHSDLFFLTNPNAPTSLLFPKKGIADFCRGFHGVVLIDEAYVDFAPENCAALALSLPNVIVARTLSKSFSLAGLRLGYAIGSAPLVDALFKIKDSYNVSMLSQHLGLAALNDLDYFRANVAKIIATRTLVTGALRKRGWKVFDSATNFIWAKPAQKSAKEVFDFLRAKKIFVRYFPAGRTGDYLRITVGTDTQMDSLLAATAGLAKPEKCPA
jgi:histidinol-phosphate aminotransferase